MPNRNDMSRYIDDKYRLLTEMIEKTSETPSQKEMDRIVTLFEEISELEKMIGEFDIKNCDINTKK